MNYTKYQDKKISRISVGHQNWYKANSIVWGERYVKEKEDILTQERNRKEVCIIVRYLQKIVKKFLMRLAATEEYQIV